MFGRMMNSFYYGKSGKGDFKKQDLPKNRWQLFWEMLRVRFSALCQLNLMTVVAWLPLIILIGSCVSTVFNATIISSDYQLYLDTGKAVHLTEEQIKVLDAMDKAEFAAMLPDVIYSTLFRFCIFAIPCIAITGPVQAGVAYVTRNWARDEHAFVWSDFKDAVKENWKQGLAVSCITSLVPLLIHVCYQFYGNMAQNQILFIIPQMLTISLGVIWCLAVTFMYPMMVTYQIKFSKLIKNGLMMAIARLPQTVGIRLVMLVPMALGVLIFMMTGSIFALMFIAGYYLIIGFALSRFVYASFTNAAFDRFINSHMEGVQVNRGMAAPEEDEEEDEEEADSSDQLPPAQN